MAWCKREVSDFSGKIFFPSKVSEFLHVLFDEVLKHLNPCIFLAGLHFSLFLKKPKTKYRSVHNERNKAEEEHLSPKKTQENVFLLN